MENSNQVQAPVKPHEKTLATLEELHPLKIAEDPRVHQKFVSLFNSIHGTKMGEQIYETEKFFFMKLLRENASLQSCSKMSLYGCFLDVAVNKLSLDPTRKLCYISPENVNAGTRDNPAYEKRAKLTISPYGEMALRQLSGQISHADNPIIVFEGDFFEIAIRTDGKLAVNYKASIPHKSEKIVGGFIRIVRSDGSVDFHVIDLPGILRLQGYSERKNRGKANALYTSNGGQIDPGFLKAKLIKHAFTSYPKITIPKFSQMEPEPEGETVDYSLEPGGNIATATGPDLTGPDTESFLDKQVQYDPAQAAEQSQGMDLNF